MPYQVEIPDEEYWRRQIKCQYACPVHTDARGYIRAIAAGQYEKAYRIARGPNPLASICGRVCGAPWEVACRRGSMDQSLAIRGLKRFITGQFGRQPLNPEEIPEGLERHASHWIPRAVALARQAGGGCYQDLFDALEESHAIHPCI